MTSIKEILYWHIKMRQYLALLAFGNLTHSLTLKRRTLGGEISSYVSRKEIFVFNISTKTCFKCYIICLNDGITHSAIVSTHRTSHCSTTSLSSPKTKHFLSISNVVYSITNYGNSLHLQLAERLYRCTVP